MATVFNDEWIVPHIPRCGGTSISHALPRSGLGFTRIAITQKTHSSHIRLQDLEYKTGIDPLSRKVLAVIRNPWDRERSHYLHLRMLYNRGNRTIRAVRAATQTFEDFVCDPKTSAPCVYANHVYPECAPRGCFEWAAQGWDEYLFYLTIDGVRHPRIRVVRLEDIEQELTDIFGQPISLERLNTSTSEAVEWTPDAHKTVYHRYWWGLSYYEHACVA